MVDAIYNFCQVCVWMWIFYVISKLNYCVVFFFVCWFWEEFFMGIFDICFV